MSGMTLRIGICGVGAAEVSGLIGRCAAEVGAQVRTVPLPETGNGGTGLVPDALATNDVDLVLCAAGSVAGIPNNGIEVMGTTRRGDPRDMLLGPVSAEGSAMDALRLEAAVAVPCVRSAGLLRARYPGVRVVSADGLGNDLARVDRGDLDAVVTSAGRAGRAPGAGRASTIFPLTEWVADPGRAALAIVARGDVNGARVRLARALIDPDSTRAVRAELAVARELGFAPGRGIGVVAAPTADVIHLLAMAVSADGRQLVRGRVVGRGGFSPEAAAQRLVGVLERRGVGLVGSAPAAAWGEFGRE